MRTETHTNALIHETSPYLKQHAHNPVDWHAWNADTLEKASREDKPLLISIGYAACHWCHVMAHESFEDEKTARLMNEHFVCVKVDREERPDVDKYYMEAVQAMTGGGGWPLHAFALPDGRPFFGGTYFPASQWQQLCLKVANEYTHSRERLITFANRLSEGESTFDGEVSNPDDNSFNRDIIHLRVRQLQAFFDPQNGGLRGAPKFPMPTLVAFLLKYGALDDNENILSHVHLTLEKMAMGGIYDHIGGGFARYSTDPFWKIPHFEKMLYDNAQLLSLYSNGFRKFKSSLFKETVEGTAQFMLHDLRTKEGGFASSIDADSEGIEGKYYVWDIDELRKSLGDLFPTAQSIFNIYPQAAWEHNTYVLHRTSSLKSAAAELKIEIDELQEHIQQIRRFLYEKRDQREHPTLDHKVLTSWNGLAIQGLADAFTAFHKPEYLQGAQDAADFVLTHARMKDGGLFHSFTDGSARITGFLEDYSAMIGGLIALYQATFDEQRLYQARDLTAYCIDHFFDPQTGFFFFTSDQQKDALKREVELDDGVTPSSNSSSAHNLFALARYFENSEWESMSQRMILKMKDALTQNLSSRSNWASLYVSHAYPYFDTAISGPQADAAANEMKKDFHANVLFAGSSVKSNLPIFENRHQDNRTFIYVCRDKVCAAPVENAAEALKLIS